MERERIIASGKTGLKAAAEFVKTKPKITILSTLALGATGSGSSLGLAVVSGNETNIIINSTALVLDAGVAGIVLRLKNSESVHQQSHPQKNSPEP